MPVHITLDQRFLSVQARGATNRDTVNADLNLDHLSHVRIT